MAKYGWFIFDEGPSQVNPQYSTTSFPLLLTGSTVGLPGWAQQPRWCWRKSSTSNSWSSPDAEASLCCLAKRQRSSLQPVIAGTFPDDRTGGKQQNKHSAVGCSVPLYHCSPLLGSRAEQYRNTENLSLLLKSDFSVSCENTNNSFCLSMKTNTFTSRGMPWESMRHTIKEVFT